jgi:hypothetical protein
MVMTVKNAVYWDVTPCGSCKNQYFRGIYSLHHQGARINVLGTILAVTSKNIHCRRYGLGNSKHESVTFKRIITTATAINHLSFKMKP